MVQPGKTVPGGVPIVRVNNLKQGVIDIENILTIDPAIAAMHRRTQLQGGEVLLSLVGSVGQTAIVPNELVGWNVARAIAVIPVIEEIGPKWIEICLRSAEIQRWITTRVTTTVQTTLNLGDVTLIPILIPPDDERLAITAIISELDDKIELNRKMNQTLEEIARTIFTSWFVRFDPVRAKAAGRQPDGMDAETAALFPDAFVDSELGLIPAGWGVEKLADVASLNTSLPLKKEQVAPYLDMANVPTQGSSAEELRDRPFGSGTRFQNGDVLLARITPCLENGKTALVDFLDDGQIGWGSTEFIVIRAKQPFGRVWAYCLARDKAFRQFAIRSMSGTSGRQRVSADAIGRYLIAKPTAEIARRFEHLTEPLFESIRQHDLESRTLRETRDVLLPKLLSGEIRVTLGREVVGATA